MPMMPDRLGLVNFVYIEESMFKQMQDRDNNTVYFVVPDSDDDKQHQTSHSDSPYI